MLRIQGPTKIEIDPEKRKTAFDMDGVLAEKPPEAAKPWHRMCAEEKKNRNLNLNLFYRDADLLYNPPAKNFIVISSRRSDMDVAFITDEWLRKYIGKGRYKLFLFSGPASLESVVNFKANVIMREKIKCFVSEDIPVLKGLSKVFAENDHKDCTLVHFAPPEIEMSLFKI